MSDRSAYAASKGAATMITRSLAVELAPRGNPRKRGRSGPFCNRHVERQSIDRTMEEADRGEGSL